MKGCADDGSVGQTAAGGADQGYAAQRERMRTLSKALEKANRAGKPLIISRLPGAASSQDSAATHCLTGDPALLLALQPKVETRAHTACSFSVPGLAPTAHSAPKSTTLQACMVPKVLPVMKSRGLSRRLIHSHQDITGKSAVYT